VNARGQITIDRAARRALAVQPGMVAVQMVVDDHLEVYFLPEPHQRSLFGVLAPRQADVGANWDAVEDRAAASIAAEA
jgi:hypothetical protein